MYNTVFFVEFVPALKGKVMSRGRIAVFSPKRGLIGAM